jgi:thiol:disulfide interchange protein DsbA
MEQRMKSFLKVVILIGLFSESGIAYSDSPNPVAGKDYVEIVGGMPLESADGKIIVEEFFNYICPACNSFESQFSRWAAQLPADVEVAYVPAAFRPDFVQYARGYYAAQSFGLVKKTHEAVYDAIHRTHTLPAEGDQPDEERVAEFYAGYGVDAQGFLAAMRSFEVDLNIRRATDHMKRSGVRGTPSIVVNGRYIVRGRQFADLLRTASYLIDKERERLSARK